MSGLESKENEWELSKENIQPLKQGRKVALLADALDESHQHKLSQQKHEFEKVLRTYSGDDPLEIWYRYALWIEQNYPKGGKDGNLKKLLDSCFTNLSAPHLIQRYKSDERYLDLWIKFANQSPSPLEIYQILNSRKLCTELAKFYETWAWEVEKTKNYTKANSIYMEGLQRKAQPLDALEMAHKKFQARVAHHIIAQGEDATDHPEPNEPSRVVLSSLKSKGSKARAPIERAGSSIIGSAGHISNEYSKPNTLGPKFQIFQDENAVSEGSLRAPLNSKSALPNQIISSKENVKDPSRWTKNRSHQRSVPLVSVEDVEKIKKPNFMFHVDENAPDVKTATASKTEVPGVLSVKEDREWVVPLFIAEEFNPLVQPQYCKSKVYCGTEEFSFEELRAARDKQRIKDQEALLMKEELRQLKDLILQQQQTISQLQQKVEAKGEPRRKVYEDSWISINKSVNATHNASQNSANLSDNTKLLINQLAPETSKLPLLSNESLNPEMLNAIGIPSYDPQNLSAVRGVAPSPTINTKIANKVISDMLSGSLFHNSSTEKSLEDPKRINAEENADLPNTPEVALPVPSSSTPFTIFCDNEVAQGEEPPNACIPLAPREQKAASHLPFSIYSDENAASKNAPTIHLRKGENKLETKEETEPNNENAPPPDYVLCQKKRTLTGVLQPSVGIPVLPLEAQEPYQEREDGREELDEMDGIENLIVPSEQDFTIKIPSTQTFTKCAKVTSTPVPWGILGQNQTDDTFAIPIVRQGNLSTNRNFGELSRVENIPPDEGKPYQAIEGDSGELMPPPVIANMNHSESSTVSEKTYGGMCKTQALSPILEASREYRSSSSNSSSGTLIGHSNIHYLTHLSHPIGTSAIHHASHSGVPTEFATSNQASAYDPTKSGYFADKSCEMSTDQAPLKTQRRQKRSGSFDPDKIAAALLESDKDAPTSADSDEKDAHFIDDKSSLLKGPFSYPNEIDPFCEELQKSLLLSLKSPIHKRVGFIALNTKMPQIKTNAKLCFGNEVFFGCRLRGAGSYAQVYQASTTDPMNVTTFEGAHEDNYEKSHMILKVQRPPARWEFYICFEVRERLKAKGCRHLLNSFTRINRGYFFDQGSILVSDYHKYGTLLNIVNGYKKAGKPIPQSVVIYYTLELLILIDELHSCEIIHGDMKPDNILIVCSPSPLRTLESFMSRETCLKIIDFGRSIDMKLLPKNVTFTRKVKTEGFQCCEMRDGRTWTYQTDLYGVASVAHSLLWGSYMDVKKVDRRWMLSGVSYQRFWDKNLWSHFFNQMLNVPSCSQIPSLKPIIKSFADELFKEKYKSSFSLEIPFITQIINEGK